MEKKKKNGAIWLEFTLLQSFPEVAHGVFLHLDLQEQESLENIWWALSTLGFARGAKLRQCHGKEIQEVGEESSPLVHFDHFDGMVTVEKGVGLLTRHADCQGAIFYDPVHRALGSAHCGWRGSVENIYQQMVNAMGKLYGTKPSELIVCIGPSLGPAKGEFINYKQELPPAFWDYQVRPNYFDFWEISQWQLESAGVPRAQIEIARICTYENSDDFFSFRRDRGQKRQGTVVGLKEK